MTASKMRADRFRLDLRKVCTVLGEIYLLQESGYEEGANLIYKKLRESMERIKKSNGEHHYTTYFPTFPRVSEIEAVVEKFQTNPAEAIEEAKTLKSKLDSIPFR